MLVLGRHLEPYPLEYGKGLTFYATRFWQNGGWTGVDLFFVLSGFLIGGLLFAEAKKTHALNVGRFLLRRGLKIYPAFYALLLVTFALRLLLGWTTPARAVVGEVFFLQNYLGGFWNHTWSLAVEEHFYVILPLLLLLLLRTGKRSDHPFIALPWIVAGVAVICLALRVHLARTQPFDNLVHLFPTHLRLDSPLIGVGVAYAYHFHHARLLAWGRRWQVPLLLGGVALFLPAFRFPLGSHWWLHSLALTGFALGAAMILIALLEREPPDWWIVRKAALLGSRSYSIYLWHSAVGIAATRVWTAHAQTAGPAGWYLYLVTYLLLSLALGVVMAAAIELPILALRDRKEPAPVSPLTE